MNIVNYLELSSQCAKERWKKFFSFVFLEPCACFTESVSANFYCQLQLAGRLTYLVVGYFPYTALE